MADDAARVEQLQAELRRLHESHAAEVAALRHDLDQRSTDLMHALERQAATAEVLKVISQSAFDIQPVFDMLLENAVRLCSASHGGLSRFDGAEFLVAATYGTSPVLRAFQERTAIAPGRGSALGRAALERRTVHILDVQADPEYSYGARRLGIRTILAVPMFRDGELIGGMFLWKGEVQLFTEQQIALLETFADQAVIAIENAHLFDELERRNGELSETLKQQTATAEVLRGIASSPTDPQLALDAMAESAARLCDASNSVICRLDTDVLRPVASRGAVRAGPEIFPLTRQSVVGRAVLDRQTIHLHHLDTAFEQEFPASLLTSLNIQSVLATPLLREDAPIGVIRLGSICCW